MNPIESQDQNVATNLREVLRNKLRQVDYIKEGEKYIVIGKDGKRLEDEHGYPITREAYLRSTASGYYEFKQTADRTGAANGNNASTAKRPPAKKMTEDEYVSSFEKAKTTEEQTALVEAWNAQNKPAEG